MGTATESKSPPSMKGPKRPLSSSSSKSVLLQSLQETNDKVLAALQPAIEEHVAEFPAADAGLDFLRVKNSVLLSYLIELTFCTREDLLRKQQQQRNTSNDKCNNNTAAAAATTTITTSRESNWNRLTECKTVMDKMQRGLDKKMRYQLEKILSGSGVSAGAAASSTKFAGAGENEQHRQQQQEEDPLQFRPSLGSDDDDDHRNSSSDGSGDSIGNNDSSKNHEGVSESENDEDIDDDLKAARMTLALAKEKNNSNAGSNDDGVYRAPRLSAVPYTNDKVDAAAEQQKRQRRRMRATEVAHAMRRMTGRDEVPESEDMHGGTDFGRQSAAARRLAEENAEKTAYEESNFIRLTTSRKEKKARKKMMREENSNLTAIADLGNLVRETSHLTAIEDADGSKWRPEEINDDDDNARYGNGKRKRKEGLPGGGEPADRYHRRGKKGIQAKNSFQAALFGGDGGSKKSKKKGRR